MLLMQHHQEGLTRRLFVIGIPSYTIKPFVDLMVKWERCSGIEWTIKRLKSLKVDLIRAQEGLDPLTWVRKNRRGEIAGTLGSIFRWANHSDRNFERAIQAFMAYTFYILPELTESQKEKFLSGINPEEQPKLDPSFVKAFKKTVSSNIRRRPIRVSSRPLVTYQGSPDKRAPRLWSQGSVPQNEKILDDLQIFNTSGGHLLYHRYKRLYEPLLLGLGKRKEFLNFISKNISSLEERNLPVSVERPAGGEIHFLQEPGGKLRSVASPFRIHQEALRPLGEEIYRLIQSLPWDCTFDQSKAHPFIQSHLRQGGRVHSIDLSSATDHFPLELQLEALKSIYFTVDWDHIDLFEEISRGSWKSPLGVLQWTKGQPLGLYPSFGAFTLTHGLLLLHLADGDYHNQFFVVGDDVVILDDSLKSRYLSMLDRMKCPWSADKSISSNKLSEFAGKIITSFKVIPQLKWRRMSNDNFLDICRLLGRRARCLLSSRQKRVFDSVAHLCDPIGLNFSLPGDNLEKMVKRTLDFYRPVETVLGSLMGLRRRINHLVYSSEEDFNSDELKLISSTFDEKVKSVMSQTIFSSWEVLLSIGIDAFDTLPAALGLKPRLPTREFRSNRRSTLERYEGYLL